MAVPSFKALSVLVAERQQQTQQQSVATGSFSAIAPRGTVTGLAGRPQSGRTHVCLEVTAAALLANTEHEAVFITSTPFNALQFLNVLRHVRSCSVGGSHFGGGGRSEEDDGCQGGKIEEWEESCLKRLAVFPVSSSQGDVLFALMSILHTAVTERTEIVVLDVDAPHHQSLGQQQNQHNAAQQPAHSFTSSGGPSSHLVHEGMAQLRCSLARVAEGVALHRHDVEGKDTPLNNGSSSQTTAAIDDATSSACDQATTVSLPPTVDYATTAVPDLKPSTTSTTGVIQQRRVIITLPAYSSNASSSAASCALTVHDFPLPGSDPIRLGGPTIWQAMASRIAFLSYPAAAAPFLAKPW